MNKLAASLCVIHTCSPSFMRVLCLSPSLTHLRVVVTQHHTTPPRQQLKGANISGSDWTDVVLRKDQQLYLCSIADGTNPVTGVSTRESLGCP